MYDGIPITLNNKFMNSFQEYKIYYLSFYSNICIKKNKITKRIKLQFTVSCLQEVLEYQWHFC